MKLVTNIMIVFLVNVVIQGIAYADEEAVSMELLEFLADFEEDDFWEQIEAEERSNSVHLPRDGYNPIEKTSEE